ncbi:MAG TPA: VCBS repeat-containing protein [Terriglobales bacterium]|nr:VCBS repeat-containing protein [Terriglobales bacterium]
MRNGFRFALSIVRSPALRSLAVQCFAWMILWSGTGWASGSEVRKEPEWVGKGKYRILVRVDPIDLGSRKSDEMPTRIHISSETILASAGHAGRLDVRSIEVGRYDPVMGRPLPYGKWVYAHADWEVPFRWYDDSIPEDFPEADNINPATGELKFTPQRGWGYFYETLGEWKSGNLAWIHTQQRNSPSYYAIYFDLLPPGTEPNATPRTGYLGDGMERIAEIGESTHGLILSRVEVADWNGDGLPDILVGAQRGGIVWYPNRGTAQDPKFPYSQLLFTVDGKPLDAGFSATPLVVDWDGDEIEDLVCGAEWNRLIWYKNVGTNKDRRLVYKGLIYADDGKPFELPHKPVPEGEGIYLRDYHPVVASADLTGDGKPDIIAGGYVTGRIYLFENRGRDRNGLPILHFVGPLAAEGIPIDVGWSAAPTVADLNGDGLLDIVSGDMPMTEGGGDSGSSEDFLYYFENVGTRSSPAFKKRRFPVQGTFPVGAIAAPRTADLNGDGLLDLVVVANTNLSIYFNVGSNKSPLWKYEPPLPGAWKTAPLLAWSSQAIDWNQDGHFDLVDGFSVRLNEGKGNPQLFGEPKSILGKGEEIFHKSPYGDQWTFTHVADVDADGKQDVLYGVHEGNVFLHRNLSDAKGTRFDVKGVLLKTENGEPIQVGPEPGRKWDFDVLQGARTTLAAADFDRDGKLDLVVGDTYGKVRYFRNKTGGPEPRFEDALLIADAGSRLVPSVVDWNLDGWPDVIIGTGQASVVLNSGSPGGNRFLAAKSLDLSYLPFQVSILPVDWNEDGDIDLVARASYGYTCWFDRTFLLKGYAAATVQKVEAR